MIHQRSTTAALAALAVIGLIVIAGPRFASASAPPTGSPASAEVTAGQAPVVRLASESQPLAATPSGGRLAVVARPLSSNALELDTVDPFVGVVSRLVLPLQALGSRVSIASGEDGSLWVGANYQLVRVGTGGSTASYAVPEATAMLPLNYRGGGGPPGFPPPDNGQITGIAVVGNTVFLGRAGAAELTTLDTATGAYGHLPLGSGVGDIAQLARLDDGHIAFSVNHSGSQTGRLSDAVGFVEISSGSVRVIHVSARAITVASKRLLFAGADGIGFLDGTLALGNSSDGRGYDLSAIGSLTDGTIVVRVAGNTHELAFISQGGGERRRVVYQAAVITDSITGGRVPYSSALVFAVPGATGGIWFALYGSPALYWVK